MLTYDLSAGNRDRFVPDAEDLDLDPEVFSALGVTDNQDHRSDKRRLRIRAEAVVNLTCDRTLRVFSKRIQGQHELAIVNSDERAGDEAEADQVVLQPFQTKIDLTSAVRDTLLLAVPVRKVAPEAESLVIPTVYGAPDESEPAYWDALNKLKAAT